jgi:hypothetical protein
MTIHAERSRDPRTPLAKRRPRPQVLGLLTLLATTLLPASALAGTYEVVGGCGNWSAGDFAPGRVAIYPECPGLVVRNVGGPFSTSAGAGAVWEFQAPGGAVVHRAYMVGTLRGHRGWQATIYTERGQVVENCPGPTCPGASKNYAVSHGPLDSQYLYMRVRCGSSSCPNNEGVVGYADMRTISITVADSTAPGVGITGGTLLSGWRRGLGDVTYDAGDNVGIKLARVLVDGSTREQQLRGCAWGAKVPCPNGGGSLSVDTTKVADGARTLTVEVVDSADNAASQSRTIFVDNTPPAAPQQFQVAGVGGWRAANSFALSWLNPKQVHAPIGALAFELCPASNAPTNRRGCSTGRRTGTDLKKADNLTVPSPGDWRARYWLVDAAGNQDPQTAVQARLRFDNTPPSVVFEEQRTDDPARLFLKASDTVSSVARVEVEARRQGEVVWRQIPVESSQDEFSAFMDDERLPAGTYELRARAIDQAGNERTSTSRSNGQPAVLALPVRSRSRLRVGEPSGRRCRGRGRRRTCRTVLVRNPRLRFGEGVKLRGRVIERRRALARVPVEVWSRPKLPGAAWKLVKTLRTGAKGRFAYRARPGRARLLRFRYPGSNTIRGRTVGVDLQVRGTSTFHVSRRTVVNGEYATFRGTVKGRPMPPGGKLVELQVFTRRRWRTFAQPRANPRTGRWSYQYRFESIRGRVTFRFRARVRGETGYPFHTGTSRQRRVRVHGL